MNKSAITPIALLTMRLLGAGAALLLNMLLAKYIDPQMLGSILAMISIATLGSILPFLTLDAGVMRFFKLYTMQGDNGALQAYYKFLTSIFMNVSCVIFIFVFIILEVMGTRDHAQNYWQWLPLLPATIVLAWMRFRSQIGNANHEVIASAIGRSFIRPILFLLGVMVIIFTEMTLNPMNISVAFLLAIMGASLVQYIVLSPMPVLKSAPLICRPEWISGGASLGLTLVFAEFLVEILVIIAALSLSGQDLAIFAIALRFAAFARFAVMAVDQSYRPQIAKALAAQKINNVKIALKSSAKMRIIFALLSSIGLMLLSWMAALTHGGIFVGIVNILPIFFIEIWVCACLGSPHFLLGQTDNATILIPFTIITILALCIGVILAGHFHGLIGVAWTSTVILSGRSILLFVLTYNRTLLNCSLLPLKAGRI